jgi:hypothetical protein
MRRENTVGVKVLKSLLFFFIGAVVFMLIDPVIFSIGGSIINTLPFETPTNFIVADYLGMLVMFLEGVVLLIYTKKWMWR